MSRMTSSRRRVSSRLRAGLGTTLALAAAIPFVTAAHAATTDIVPAGSGLTMPEGIAVTPAGDVWVSDALRGICRVDPNAAEKLAASQYCMPEPGDAEPAPPPRLGPSTAHQMALDVDSRNFFVAEGDSKNAGIWRLHLSEDWQQIEIAQKIVSTGDNRVFALAIGRTGDDVYVDFNGRDEAVIRRLEQADTAAPGAATQVVGAARGTGVSSMANLDGSLYLAEGGGVTHIATPGPAAPTAEAVPGFPAATGSVPNALAADRDRERVYAGTANPSAPDTVDVLTPGDGRISTYESGFAFVTGLAVRPSGALLVADDAPTAAGAPESLGQSRLAEVALHSAHLATVTITDAPAVFSSATSATFGYRSPADVSFSCRLDGGDPTPCGSGLSGTQLYTNLADGTHTFEVRGDDGPAAKHVFTVDTVAPSATIDNSASDEVIAGDTLRMRLSADEFGVTYACALDGRPLAVCEPPVWLRNLTVGKHTFTATPADLAGNTGATVSWTFTRTAPAPAGSENSGSGSSSSATGSGLVGASSGPGSAAQPASGSSAAATSCTALAAPRRKATYRLNAQGRGRILTARIAAPPGARYAKLTLHLRGNGKLMQKLVLTSISGARQDLRVVLTPRQAAQLRSRRAVVSIAYGTCPWPRGDRGELTLTISQAAR